MADITIAAAPTAVQTATAALLQKIEPTLASNHHSGLLQFNWDIALRMTLTAGKASLTLTDPVGAAPGTINISSIDVHWDKFDLELGVNLPTTTIGGFCILPNPFGGCLVHAPRITLFDGNPDVSVTLDLSGWIVSTISLSAAPEIAPLTIGTQAYEAVYLNPLHVDLELINITKSVSNLIDLIIAAALAPLPGWAKDAIEVLVGPLDEWVATVLGIGQDIDRWLWEVLLAGGLWDDITTLIAAELAHNFPLFKLANPVIVDTHSSAVKTITIPLENAAATVTAAELLITTDLKGP